MFFHPSDFSYTALGGECPVPDETQVLKRPLEGKI
jgi:hypothetical protein